MKQLILTFLTKIKMRWIKVRLWKPLIRASKKPHEVQTKLLLKIIEKNSNTTFGKDHKFKSISNINDYQKHVSINSYEDLKPFIDLQESEKKPHLCSDQPIMYTQTSGSSSAPKLIPINRNTTEQYRLSQHLVAYAIYSFMPDAYQGKILAIVSPAIEGRISSGTPYGSMSGLIYSSMPRLTRLKYVLPTSVFDIESYDQKYYDIALHALMAADISMVATANPSTLVKLEQVIIEQIESLISDIAKLNPKRANALKRMLDSRGELVVSDLWPQLKVITTWTGGSCAVQLTNIYNRILSSTKVIELGYLASEFRGGITVDAQANIQIPAIHENFYEFIERADWENKKYNIKTLDQIIVGKQYYIFVTTQAGLYRYNINDVIEVTGWFNKTPTIRFVQKGVGIVSLTGEKLYENQVIKAVIKLLSKKTNQVPFFIMLGCSKEMAYTLYIENLVIDSVQIEQEIGKQNIEFKTKIASGRLKPINVLKIKPQTGEAYKKDCIKKGQREAQFKLKHLQYRENCSFKFEQYCEGLDSETR